MVALLLLLASASVTWHDLDNGRIEARVNGKPVLVYNAGMQLANGAPEDKRRCCYVHPLYSPNGVVVTDDFPADHWHHRGVFWSWPRVRFEGQQYDMWLRLGPLERRTVSVKKDGGALLAENGWFLGERQVVRERVRIRPESAERIGFDLEFEALAGPVELIGAPEDNKGYGGFSIRFAPRKATVIKTDSGIEQKDTDMVPHPWAELSAEYANGSASVRIDDPDANGWCLRRYGFLGVNYPGLKPAVLRPGEPLRLRYFVTVGAKPSSGANR
jgi:hypothetical protein